MNSAAGRFKGQVAAITGASSGIGAALVREFAREGAAVALLARRTERLEPLVAEIVAAGGRAVAIACDVRDRAALDVAAATVREVLGPASVVVANAGFGVSGPLTKLTTDDFRRQFDTNVFGVLDTIYAFLPQLRETRGRLGVIGSVSGRVGTPGTAAYSASKFAVVGLAESIWYELRGFGVSVTCINPGLVESEIRSVNNRGELTASPDFAPKWLVMPSVVAARHIVRAIHRRKPEYIVTYHGKLMAFVARHFPRTFRFIIGTATRGNVERIQRKKGDAGQ